MDDKVQELLAKAAKNVKVADHMAHVTYPLFQDPKILLAITENIFLALSSGMSLLLYTERNNKAIPAYPDNFDYKYKVFKETVAPRYGIDPVHIKLVSEVKNIVLAHRKSPVEFIRDDRFVICDDDYEMKTLTVEQIKQYVSWTKAFINTIQGAVTNDE